VKDVLTAENFPEPGFTS